MFAHSFARLWRLLYPHLVDDNIITRRVRDFSVVLGLGESLFCVLCDASWWSLPESVFLVLQCRCLCVYCTSNGVASIHWMCSIVFCCKTRVILLTSLRFIHWNSSFCRFFGFGRVGHNGFHLNSCVFMLKSITTNGAVICRCLLHLNIAFPFILDRNQKNRPFSVFFEGILTSNASPHIPNHAIPIEFTSLHMIFAELLQKPAKELMKFTWFHPGDIFCLCDDNFRGWVTG